MALCLVNHRDNFTSSISQHPWASPLSELRSMSYDWIAFAVPTMEASSRTL